MDRLVSGFLPDYKILASQLTHTNRVGTKSSGFSSKKHQMATVRRRPESQSASHEGAAERQELFNRVAPLYDKLNDLFSLGSHRLWKRWSISWSGAKEGDKVLNVCCGSRDLSFLLSEKVGINGKVIAPDFSKELLEIKFRWFEGDATNLPFTDSTFDAATISYGLRNVVDRKEALQEMYLFLNQDWTIDYIVVPIASCYGPTSEYRYLKNSIKGYLTGNEFGEAGFRRRLFRSQAL